MKVAMFSDSFYPTVDGAVIAMERQCEGLEARGHEIVMLVPDTPEKVGSRRPVHYMPSVEFRSYRDYRIVVSPSDMLEHLREEKVDIIHCHGLASMAILSLTAARALRLPSVLTFHTMANEAVKYYSFIGLRDDLLVPLVWVYLRNLLRRPDMVVFPSTPIMEEVLGHDVKPRAHEIIPTGVDCHAFTAENRDPSVLAERGLTGNRVVLHVGRLSKEKRLDIVIRAIAELKRGADDLRLLVLGSGPAEEDYRALVRELGLSNEVVFTGFASDELLAKAYATCDILAIASTFETQGLVVLEAMASGTPVAGMNCRAIPEFVRDDFNGTLFGPGTCADGIRRCLDGREGFRMNALDTARRYSSTACAERLEAAYERAASIKKARMA